MGGAGIADLLIAKRFEQGSVLFPDPDVLLLSLAIGLLVHTFIIR